jgi:thiol:disulfide interchange protein DsbD
MRLPFCLAALAALLAAAPADPVVWKIAGAPAKPVKAGARFTVKLAAIVEPGWHIYGTRAVEGGPIATRVWIAAGQPFEAAGAVQAPPPESVHDASFDMEVDVYGGEAAFTIPAKAAVGTAAGAQTLTVSASYQSCNNKICLPPKTVKIAAPVTVAK